MTPPESILGHQPPIDTETTLTAYPPLGQLTQTTKTEVAFHVVLRTHGSRVKEPWEVALCHSRGDGQDEWVETLLSPVGSGNDEPSHLQSLGASSAMLYFKVLISIRQLLLFTFKYREGPGLDWRWVNEDQGLGDGIVVINDGASQKDVADQPRDVIQNLNSALTVKSHMSQCPGTQLWTFEARVEGAEGESSAFKEVEIGLPWGGFLRWFAEVRSGKTWLAPKHGQTKFSLDDDAILCSFINPRGRHLVLLAVSGVNNVQAVFGSTRSGRVALRIRNDDENEQPATVIAAVGDNFESTNAAVMYHARSFVSSLRTTAPLAEKAAESLQDKLTPQWMEEWCDGLGFCTWNALGQRLTEQKVVDAVDALAASGVNITNLIIDDNWQSLDYRGPSQFQHGWNEFEADSKAFPGGLKATVTQIRRKHPNVQNIAVWHAMLGYWGGISPDGKIAGTYKTTQVAREERDPSRLPLDGQMTVVAKEDVQRLYDDFYRFLVSCGVNGVKTDVQSFMDTWTSATARRDLTTEYQDAWSISSLRYFGQKVISCMSQVPQIIFHSQLPTNRPAVLCRNSQDFYPDDPFSHSWHIWANAHNSLLTQHLNTLPDWDMFQTVHGYSTFHAAARCISGGPIYITDVPGKHNIDLIKQMTGVTPRGKTAILRPSVLGRSLHQYAGYQDNVLLKVGSYHGASMTGTPMVAVFNVSRRPLTEIVPLSDFPGIHQSVNYVVRAYSTGKLTEPVQSGSPQSLLTVSLGVRGHDIFTAYTVSRFQIGTKPIHVANLGLLGKMTGAAAIVASSLELQENGRVLLDTRLKALGRLGVYISSFSDMSVTDNFMATIQGMPIPPKTVSRCSHDNHVLEIDVETAWKEMDLWSGWSNEVEVKLYISID